MTSIIIGSTAIRHWFPDFPRDPNDLDRWGPDKDPGTDTYWDPRIEEWFSGFHGYADPDELYTIKVSHSSWDLPNGSWDKHMHDVVWLRNRGCKLIPELWDLLQEVWKDLHGRPKVNLNQESGAFFTDAVVRIYDHDSIHDTVAHYDRPLWMEVLKDGQTVSMDMDKVWALSSDDRIKLFREEVYATALERWMIPADYEFSPTQAYHWALRKTITSLTKGKSSRFMIMNYHIFRDIPRMPYGEDRYQSFGSGGIATPWYMWRHFENKEKLVKL